jgi:HAD superfamily hydrolase (TIGR01450 family)
MLISDQPNSRPILQRRYLIDLDGTLLLGRRPAPGAKDLLTRVRGRFVVVSNDSEHVPSQLARKLRGVGLPVEPDRIILAGVRAVDALVREYPGAKVLLLASPMLQRYARRCGLRLQRSLPEVIMVARDRGFSYADLAAATDAIRGGAELMATNPDVSHPGADGHQVPDTGALLVAILACSGSVPVRMFGKPDPQMLHEGLRRLDGCPREGIMIGDNAATDGQAAQRAGIQFVRVVAAIESEGVASQRLTDIEISTL